LIYIDTAAGILSNRDAKEKLTEKDEAQKEKKERVYNTEEDVVGIYNERIKVTHA
jgi:hypothetical protein